MNRANQIRKELRIIVRELGLLNRNSLNSGMTLVQAHILNYLVANGETSFNELLLQLGCDKASLSRTINNLVTKNYVASEKLQSDKRMKSVSITSTGLDAIKNAEYQAENFIEDILSIDHNDSSSELVNALKAFRILALRKSILECDSKLIFEELKQNYYKKAMNLVLETFNGDQNIPKELIPISKELTPMWWCIRIGEDVVGVVACWIENSDYHLGRIAVDKEFRKMGIGKKLILNSIKEIFANGGNEIYLDARDVTVKIIQRIGGKIIGDSVEFYGDSVTPMILKKSDFLF
ncbi:GNAT family N-acetyltransferase [Wukongibacter baidiensis]|uniref:GNAT family N-acetyltransferase n=1 Tax=Wukongibacter baidiensis TaxID=1723361 RepID=UPI003D7F5B2F